MAYIDKDLLLKDIAESVVFSVKSGVPSPELRGARKIIDRIKNAPTADVEEVKHGIWSRGTEPSGSVYAHCSACNRKMNYSCYGYARCSLCGAKMDGGKEE